MKFLATAVNKIKEKFKNIVLKFNAKNKHKRRRSYSKVASTVKKNVATADTNVSNNTGRTGRVVRMGKTSRSTNFFVFVNRLKINKKRFLVIVSVVVVAVAVPVIVVAANNPLQPSLNNGNSVPQANFEKKLDDADTTKIASASQVQGATTLAVDEQQVPEPTATPQPTPTPVVYKELSDGMTDPNVIKIQERLMELNYMDNDEPTELFGSITAQAIGFFQRKHGLNMDGVAGEETQKLLFAPDAKHYSVTVGGEGADVESIQDRLSDLGYPVSVTAYFGTETEDAIKYFQRMNGLDVDGSVGAYTKEVLFSSDAEPALEKPKKSKSTKKSSGNKGGSSSGGGGGSTDHVANPGTVSGFLEAAQSLNGVPYVRGGKSSGGVDCSGFVYVAMQNAGIGIGYMTSGGWAGSGYPTVSSMSDLQAGDIVCFNGHVGIYLGGGSMIDASSGEGRVRYCSNIQGSNYWTKNFICGKRPL